MKRREFAVALGSCTALAVLTPLAARSQQPGLPVIGFLSTRTARDSVGALAGFHRGLAEVGLTEGRHVTVEYRWADGHVERLAALAAELVASQVAVIVAVGGPRSSIAAKAATRSIPIVFAMGDDPVKLGLVASMNRPGGNITGATQLGGGLSAKRFQLLRELVPSVKTVAVLVNPNRPDAQSQAADLQKAAQSVGMQVALVKASAVPEIEGAFLSAVQQGAGALFISNDPLLNGQRELLAMLGVRHKLPTMAGYRENAESGALMSYGNDTAASYQQAGVYAGRILKGAKTAELPVVQPTRFELVINLKTAKILRISIPQALLVSATKVIE
jgi:putative ABC transport system substrate-binding protein